MGFERKRIINQKAGLLTQRVVVVEVFVVDVNVPRVAGIFGSLGICPMQPTMRIVATASHSTGNTPLRKNKTPVRDPF